MLTAGELCHFLNTEVPRFNETLRRILVAGGTWPTAQICWDMSTHYLDLPPTVEENLIDLQIMLYNIAHESLEETRQFYDLDSVRERIRCLISQLNELFPDAGIYEGWE